MSAPAQGVPETYLRPYTTLPVHVHWAPSESAHTVQDDAVEGAGGVSAKQRKMETRECGLEYVALLELALTHQDSVGTDRWARTRGGGGSSSYSAGAVKLLKLSLGKVKDFFLAKSGSSRGRARPERKKCYRAHYPSALPHDQAQYRSAAPATLPRHTAGHTAGQS